MNQSDHQAESEVSRWNNASKRKSEGKEMVGKMAEIIPSLKNSCIKNPKISSADEEKILKHIEICRKIFSMSEPKFLDYDA